MAEEIEEGGDPISPLPSQHDDEFRPFVRRLPEWQFWSVFSIFALTRPTQPFSTPSGSRRLVLPSSPYSVPSQKYSMFPSIGPFSLYISSPFLP